MTNLLSTASYLSSVLQLRIPIRSATARCEIENRPQRCNVGRVARILAGVCHLARHLAGPEQAHLVAFALEDDERRILAVRLQQIQITCVVVADSLNEVQLSLATFLRE